MVSSSRIGGLSVVATVALIAVACGSQSDVASGREADEGVDAGTRASTSGPLDLMADAGTCTPTAPIADNLTDGAVVALLAAEHLAEIALAQQEEWRLESPGAIAFAEKSVTDHTLLYLGLKGAMRADDVGLLADDDSAEITAAEQREAQWLGNQSGPLLDRAYLAFEVLAHVRELALLDRMLGPSVRDPRVSDAIRSTRAIASTHVALAIAVQSVLEASP